MKTTLDRPLSSEHILLLGSNPDEEEPSAFIAANLLDPACPQYAYWES